MIYLSQGTYFVALPESQGFAISPTRMQAARTAVAGNVIRQESVLHASTAEATYSRNIPAADAATLEAMHASSSAVTLHYRNHGYTATMSLKTTRKPGGMVEVSIRLGIVRELT